MNSIFKTFILSLMIIANTHLAYAQTASILPPAKTTFLDSNGNPLTAGTVTSYIPGTTTKKTTWQDAAETIPNQNPLTLDAAGRALLLGSGSYRQVVKDKLGNLIWDQVTSSTGSGGGSSTTATGDGDLVGTIKPWAGMTAPNQYAFTYGQEISRATYSVLFTAITSAQAAFCTSGSAVLSGLSDTTNFWIGMPVEVSCVAAGFSTIISKTATTVTLAANANVTVNTTATFLPWGRGNGSTTFNLPDFRGVPIAGNNNMGGTPSANLTTTYFGATNPNSVGASGGSQSVALNPINLPPYTPTGTISGTASVSSTAQFTNFNGNISVAAGGNPIPTPSGGNQTVVSTGSISATFSGVSNGGTTTPFSIIQPIKTSNYIIKITPDANSATASGVTSIQGMTGDIACSSGLLCTGNTIGVSASAGFLSAASNLSDVQSATTSTQNLFGGQYIGALVNSFGAINDGVTNNTRYFVDAANYASANKVGLILKSGSNYRITPIQFGGSNPTTGTFTGSISGTTLTVTVTPTIPLAVGQEISGSGITSGTIITGFGNKTAGWIGTYTVSVSQTVASTTISTNAPFFTASFSGTNMVVSGVATGKISLGDSIVGAGVVPGTTVISQTSGSTGLTGTYVVTYTNIIGTPISVRAYPLTVVPLPTAILGAAGGQTQTIIAGFGSNSVPTPLVKIVNPPALGAVLGFEIANLRINAVGLYGNALAFHGFSKTSSGGQAYAHDLTAANATSSTCGVNMVGNTVPSPGGPSWGIIEAQFSRISSEGNTVCDYNLDGNDGDGSHNIQAVQMDTISADSASTGNGFNLNYAEVTCINCLSQNHSGVPIAFNNVYHNIWTNFYSESDIAGAITSTANTFGVHMTGTVVGGVDSGLLSCATCDIDIHIGSGLGTYPTNTQRNFGGATGQTIAVKGSSTTTLPSASTGVVGASSAAGLQLIGNGTVNDVVIYDDAGDVVCSVPTGVARLSCTMFDIGGKAIVLGGGFTMAGAFGFTGTLTGTTAVTFPTAGTLSTLAGAETLANKTVTSPILTTTTVSALPACASGTKSMRSFVTDNNTALAFAAVITTGGTIQTPVYCDGTVWRQG